MDDTLSVGDIVCLYSSESYGFLLTTQSSSVHNQLAVGSKQDRVRPDIQDQHVISFEICVANRYKLNKKYRKLCSKLNEDPENLSLRTNTTQAQLAAQAENDDNNLEQKRQQGKKVVYGQVVQLKNSFSQKYIHVSTTKTSETESNNMAVELLDHNAKHSQFKIMPRYKVKAEGDVVQVDDQIVMESVKSPSSYLHVSKGTVGINSVYAKCHELNLSVQQSGFTIYRKHKPGSDDENKVKVGDVIRFYHKEMEAYLVAEGLFDQPLLEDVHLRMRPMDQTNPKTLFPSTSAVTYWQIELQDGPISGGILKWEQQCKIIHMCSRKYLTYTNEKKVTLTSDHEDPRTVFRLHPVIRENDDIPVDSYCRIEHVVSGYWLHAVMAEYKRKQETTSTDTKAMGSLKWSSAQLKQSGKKKKGKVGAIPEKQYDDAFTIQSVEPELVEIFNYMAGMVPFIQKLVKDKNSGLTLNAKMAHDALTALSEMRDFMIVNSVPSKKRQKLMRNLRIVELLVQLLQTPFRGSPDQIHLTRIFVEAYDVLYTYLMGDSRKNELYIAKYIDFFLSQFEYKEGQIGLNAAHMVMELIRDNRKIVDRISHEHIDKFVELLRRDKNYRYLDLLSVLCVCDGVSIADNQKYITEVWLMKGNRNCVFNTDLGQKIGKVQGVVYVSTNMCKTWMELADFAKDVEDDDDDRHDNDETYLFLVHQLELFGMLCHGQNDFSIQVITEQLNYLTWEEAFTCLSDHRLPDQLRAQYCDLIITMFVDIGDNHSVIDRVKLSYIYDEIDQFEDARSPESRARDSHANATKRPNRPLSRRDSAIRSFGSALRNNILRPLSDGTKALVESHIQDDTVLDAIDITQSTTYKYFPSISDWISKFLNKNSDMTASEIGNNMLVKQVLRLVHYLVSFGFYYKSEDIKKLMGPLMSLIDGRNDKPYPNVIGKEGEEVMKHFNHVGRYERSPETQAVVDAKCQALGVLNLFFNFIFNLRLEKFMNLFKDTHTQANQTSVPAPELGALLYETFDLSKNLGTKVSTKVRNPVSKHAMKKLNEIFDETAFLKGYDLVNVLKDLSHYQYDEMVRMSMHLLNRFYSAHNNLFNRAVQAQVCITDSSVSVYKELENILPKMRRYSTAKLSDNQTLELCGILDRLNKMCHLENEPEEPHGMNQSILYNHGVLEDAFTILTQEIDVKLLEQYSGQRKIFQKTFTLLKLMARSNKLVQGRLFDRLDMLLSKEGAGPELAEALTEVFTGNSNTCMKISGNQVMKVMGIVAKQRENVPQFLDLLNAIVKVEELDLPLKRNQGFVMQYFMQYRSDVAFVIDQDENSRSGWEKTLTENNHKDLQYLIAMVDMLATCAEGENRFIESICQTIFKIPELLRILNNKKITDNLKRPFLRFFLWVYLNTAGGMIESGAGDLPHDVAMWEYLNGLNETLRTVTEYIKTDPNTVKLLLKRPPAKGENGSDKGINKQEVIRGTLHYLFDGVMPFLQIFCRSYYQPDASMFPSEPQQLDDLARNFKDFMTVAAPLISLEKQMKNIVSCMTTVMSASTLPVSDMEEFQEEYGGKIQQDVRSDARKMYEDFYETEEDINLQLNVFAVNMKVAYGGINSVEVQLGHGSPDTEYSELGGDEELPLGAEFQDHLSCLIDKRKKTSVEKYAMAEKLVKQLEISSSLTHLNEKEKLEQVDLDVKCLQLLRGLIHNEMIRLPEDWEGQSQAHRRQLKVIEEVQNALNTYGVVTSVLEHLSRPQDNVVREVLAFLAALLFNGNDEVQASLISYFTGTREETFFFSIKGRMNMSAIATREKRLLQAMHTAKLDEAIQQAKALKKAMQTGHMATIEIMKANQMNSMLSIAKKSMANLRLSARQGTKLGASRRSVLGGSRRFGSRLKAGPSSRSNSNNVLMPPPNGIAGKQGSVMIGNKNSKVAPTPNPEIQVENVEDEELEELMQHAYEMTADLDFHDDGYIELVLRILGLMCDNQHNGLQDYLREQPDNIKSVNLVAETTRFLNILYSNINDRSMALIVQLFDTLVEFTSGNQQNQAVVFDNKICDYINHILRVGVFKGCKEKDVYILKKSIATLIKSLSEENPPDADEDNPIATLAKDHDDKKKLDNPKTSYTTQMEVMEYLDTDTLANTMTEAYKQIQKACQAASKERNSPDFEDIKILVTDTGFAYFHILCRKMDLDEKLQTSSFIRTPEQEEAWMYFSENTLSIEILKEDVLQKIYYRVKDKKVLRNEIKEKFKYEVDRTSPSNKLRDFMDWASDVIQDIKYQRKVYSNSAGRLLVNLWLPMNYIVLLLSVIISVVILVVWRDPKTSTGESDTLTAIPELSIDNYYVFLYIMGGIHSFLCFLIYVTFLISNSPTFPPWNMFLRLIGRNNDDDMEFRSWHEKKMDSHLEVKIYSFKSLYYLCFLAFSILGIVFHGYFFAFHLLHIAELNQLLKRVILAVTTNGKSLLMVTLLGLAILFIYSLVAFALLREKYFLEGNGRHCRTVGQCFISMIHHGLVDSPYTTIEAEMNNSNYTDVLMLTVFDVTFFILITTIGLNIIFGIIVDTFSQLRDSKWEIDKDMLNNCFICSRESYDFERQGGGFEKHVKEEHNQWAYLFFFIHLDETRPNDYSALELYVFKMLQTAKYDFFPLNRALSLQNEEDTNERKLEQLRISVEYMVNKMKEEEAAREREKEKRRQLAWEQQHRKS
ncbi:inositol 1,4,5-trisphosphate receptor type 3-like isoform X6 [Pecten maximus]|uniref:inositol 1,4,5-trisphosphate receptor type 3-like isoform X6 n=1 Tax=Pecten maximus TaxID=6579 RepID=UPI0014586653|nr:inositol 1,4,5-trisphosphate receptor type 3-like isoform X6 [Pecten maximus]